MPRRLQTDSRVPVVDGVLIKRQAILDNQRVHATLQQARIHARRLVKEAQENADAIRRDAMAAGYQDAWLSQLSAVFAALSDSERLRADVRGNVQASLRNALETSLQHPEVALQLIDGWLASGSTTTTTLQVVVPTHARHLVDRIRQRIEQKTGASVHVAVGEHCTVSISDGDRVFEFNPEACQHAMTEIVEQSLRRLNLKQRCQDWSDHAVHRWMASLQASRQENDADAFGTLDPDDFDFLATSQPVTAQG